MVSLATPTAEGYEGVTVYATYVDSGSKHSQGQRVSFHWRGRLQVVLPPLAAKLQPASLPSLSIEVSSLIGLNRLVATVKHIIFLGSLTSTSSNPE